MREAAPILWLADMPVGFHNPEPWYKIRALREAGHPVLFVDQIGITNPRPRNVAKVARYVTHVARRTPGAGGEAALRLALLPPRHHRATDAVNNRLVGRRLSAELERRGLSRPVLWFRFPSPELVAQIGRLGERLVVYECVDRFGAFDYPSRHLRVLRETERRLLDRADLTIVTSEGLRRFAEPLTRRVELLRNGVDTAGFAAPHPVPADLAALRPPRVGYTGPIDARLDVPLIEAVADAHPRLPVVLIGPTGSGSGALRLARLPNVHLLGTRPHELIAAYVQHLDVGLLPYLSTAVTADMMPVKALEFLAAGRPVVATRLPELERFSSVMELADDRAAFVAAVGRSLAGGVAGVSARREAVAGDDWSPRTTQLIALLDAALESVRR